MTSSVAVSDSDLMDLAAELLLAAMRSASTDTIRPMDWWPRAKSALETGAGRAENYPQMVSTMARKLQIDSYNSASSRSISEVRARVEAEWPRFRRMCERDAVYVAALAQAMRDVQRGEWEERKAAAEAGL